LDSSDAPGGSSDFQQELLALRQDPQVRGFARRLVGDLGLVEDVNQMVCCRLLALKHHERIENLRAYYFRVLRNEATKLLVLWQETPFEDGDDAPVPAELVDEKVCNSLHAQIWLDRLADWRDRLLAAIPDRSADPALYRAVIYNTADEVLRDGINGEPCDADSNDALCAAYPEYFAQLNASADLLHQRFRRARLDVRALLQKIVNRDELT
jgi:DNA-directed RNA polymerase specialized sigma24 family protein